MELSKNGIELIKKFEGCRLTAYLCPAGIPTIGYGSTYYEDGSKVKMGDKITQERAEALLINVAKNFYHQIKGINQNQFDAITSFCFNLGNGNFNKSNLKRKITLNPNDPTITDEFMKWTRAGGRILNGLVARRRAEAQLYFKK